MTETCNSNQNSEQSIAIFPGSFDPITLGHIDIVERAAKIFDKIIIAIGDNPEKKSTFSIHERIELIESCTEHLSNVEVTSYNGLTVNFAKKVGAKAMIRGLRNSGDFQYESQIAFTNQAVTGIETLFILSAPEHAFTSSSLIRQVASMKGDVTKFVPEIVAERLLEHH